MVTNNNVAQPSLHPNAQRVWARDATPKGQRGRYRRHCAQRVIPLHRKSAFVALLLIAR